MSLRSAAPGPCHKARFPFAQEFAIAGDGAIRVRSQEKTLVGGFVEDFTQHRSERFPEVFHTPSSAAYLVVTNGVSCVAASLLPRMTLIHTRADSSTITLTSTINNPHTTASRRSLKMRRARP